MSRIDDIEERWKATDDGYEDVTFLLEEVESGHRVAQRLMAQRDALRLRAEKAESELAVVRAQ